MNFETMKLLDRSVEINIELANALTGGHYETLMKFKELQDAVLVHKKEQEEALPKPEPEKKGKQDKPKIEPEADFAKDDLGAVKTDYDPLSDEPPPEENEQLPF